MSIPFLKLFEKFELDHKMRFY